MSVTLYTELFNKTDAAFTAYIGSTAASVISSIKPVATVLLMIYVMLWGWSMMRGVIEEPITDGVTRIVRLSIICGIALSTSYYSSYISDWIWKTPDALAKIVSGQDGKSGLNFLDGLLSEFFDLAADYIDDAYKKKNTVGIPDLMLMVIGVAVYVAGIALTGYAAFLFLLSKMALATLLAVGAIFILLAIFESTKKFLDAWIAQTANYVFLIMLTSAVCKLLLIHMESYIPANAEDLNVANAIQLLAISMVGFLVLMQVPTMASALGGGAAISTLGAIGAAWSKMRGAAKSAGNLINGKTLTNMRAARKRKSDMAAWAKKNPMIPEYKSKPRNNTNNSIKKS
jgi:type IV secretion system protein VirB6